MKFTDSSKTDNTTPLQEDGTATPSSELESHEEVERRVRKAIGMVRLPNTLAAAPVVHNDKSLFGPESFCRASGKLIYYASVALMFSLRQAYFW